MISYEIYQGSALIILIMCLTLSFLLTGGNINVSMFNINIDNHTEDKSIRTGNTARIDYNSEEIRAIE